VLLILQVAGWQVTNLRQVLEAAGKEHDGRDEAAKKVRFR
jgi:hypothetical protein